MIVINLKVCNTITLFILYFRYKVKLQPGSTKRGKGTIICINKFIAYHKRPWSELQYVILPLFLFFSQFFCWYFCNSFLKYYWTELLFDQLLDSDYESVRYLLDCKLTSRYLLVICKCLVAGLFYINVVSLRLTCVVSGVSSVNNC